MNRVPFVPPDNQAGALSRGVRWVVSAPKRLTPIRARMVWVRLARPSGSNEPS